MKNLNNLLSLFGAISSGIAISFYLPILLMCSCDVIAQQSGIPSSHFLNGPFDRDKEDRSSLQKSIEVSTQKNSIPVNPMQIPTWHREGILSGTSTQVSCMAYDANGNLYIGGGFRVVDTTRANYIAKWDGQNWIALGVGPAWAVSSICFDPSGNLYAAGGSNVFKWDGFNWTTIGTADNYIARVISDSLGNLYIGGSFTTLDGSTTNRIAKWNGNTWSSLGTGTNGEVCDIKLDYSGMLYAGGFFTSAGGNTANNVAKWNGTSWSALGIGVNSTVRALETNSTGDVFVGGNFTSAGGNSAVHLAKWNGITWDTLTFNSIIANGNTYVRDILLDSSGLLYVSITRDFMEKGTVFCYDTVWNNLDSSTNGRVDCMLLNSNNDLLVGGFFSVAGHTAASNIAKWNGSTWQTISSLSQTEFWGPSRITSDNNGNLFLSGTKTDLFDFNSICKYDGTNWTLVGNGAVGNASFVRVDSSGNVYAAGQLYYNGSYNNSVMKWDGSNWTVLGGNFSTWVNDFVLDDNDSLYIAVGGIVYRWNNSSWIAIGTFGGVVYTISCDHGGNIYASGTFTTVNGVSANRIAKWNGSSWSSLGSGLNDIAYDIVTDAAGDVYVTGIFTTAGGLPVNRIAKWDGINWMTLGSGLDTTGYRIITDNAGNIIVGGLFQTAGGVPANIAKWDGTSWSSLSGNIVSSSGYMPVIVDLYMHDSSRIWVSGSFSEIGGSLATGLAYYELPPSIHAFTNKTEICIGDTATLTANGANSYLWMPGSNSGNSFSVTPTSTTTYTVTGTGNNGVTNIDTITVIVRTSPALNLSVSEPSCGLTNGSISITAIGTAPFQYLLDTLPSQAANSFSGLVANQNYSVCVIDSFGCKSCNNFLFPDSCDLVWPGDANDDLIVDNLDILAIAVGNGTNGVSRFSSSMLWNGYPSLNWAQTLVSGSNYKHIDCDGDAYITLADTNAVIQNYNFTRPASKYALIPLKSPSILPPLKVEIVQDSLYAGTNGIALVFLGDSAQPVTSLYGLAFTLHVDPSYIDPASFSINSNGSWLDTSGSNLMAFALNDGINGVVKSAITRFDHKNISGSGLVATLNFKLKSNYSGNQMVTFFASGAIGIDSLYNQVFFNTENDSVFALDQSIGIKEVSESADNIYPNPFNDYLILNNTSDVLSHVQVYDVTGKIVFDAHSPAKNSLLDVSRLKCGLYYLKIQSGCGTSMKKLIKY